MAALYESRHHHQGTTMAIEVSRRGSFLAAALPLALFNDLPKADVQLKDLGFEFDKLAARLDTYDSCLGDLELFEKLFDDICSTPATTIEGLCVKARVGCWTLLGDFDSASKSIPGAQLAFSIMQDLIRTYHPELENPGAVQKLIGEQNQ
jgi:hypothetical protein